MDKCCGVMDNIAGLVNRRVTFCGLHRFSAWLNPSLWWSGGRTLIHNGSIIHLSIHDSTTHLYGNLQRTIGNLLQSVGGWVKGRSGGPSRRPSQSHDGTTWRYHKKASHEGDMQVSHPNLSQKHSCLKDSVSELKEQCLSAQGSAQDQAKRSFSMSRKTFSPRHQKQVNTRHT